ncbi:MAG: hypothetical protein JWN07_494, partial [Hyphomicrobiales bacterium]|nr:hypothetical protein [Hyphomicrobiales bacterium]
MLRSRSFSCPVDLVRLPLPLVSSILIALPVIVVLACGGGEGSPPWTIDRLDYSDQSGLPFLSPGNDTRINLAMLAEDPARASLPATIDPTGDASLFSVKTLEEAHSWHAGAATADDPSRCQSQTSGAVAYTAALARAAGLADSERERLGAARTKLLGCDGKTIAVAAELSGDLADMSPQAKAYATYLV